MTTLHDKHLHDLRPLALVVDDEALVRFETSDVLTDAGYRVIEAATVDQALNLIEAAWPEPVQLLVTDNQMPGRDGLSLAHEVARRTPRVGVVMCSCWPQPPESLPDGACFLSRPVAPHVLVSAARRALHA